MNATDRGHIEEIITHLKKVETDYHINLSSEKEWLRGLAKEEPVSEDLEQAIDTYLATYFGGEKEKQEWPFMKKMAIHFVNWQKQQMMKDADDYLVDDDNTIKRFYDTGGVVGKPIIFGSTPDSINVGDHVKVIVIKEE